MAEAAQLSVLQAKLAQLEQATADLDEQNGAMTRERDELLNHNESARAECCSSLTASAERAGSAVDADVLNNQVSDILGHRSLLMQQAEELEALERENAELKELLKASRPAAAPPRAPSARARSGRGARANLEAQAASLEDEIAQLEIARAAHLAEKRSRATPRSAVSRA